MEILLTFPSGVFFLIWGLLWVPKPKKEDDDLDDILDEEDDDKLSPEEMSKYLRRLALKLIILIIGIIGIGVGIFNNFGSLDDTNTFVTFMLIYTVSFLILQRAVKNARLLVFFTMALGGYLAWQYADFRGFRGEHNWGLLAGVGINFIYWIFIGRNYLAEDQIEVLT